ncbi:MAG: alpha/beta hydrolase [Acidobacteriaceae bacterium]
MSDSNPFPSRIKSVDSLYGPAGRLEAILNTGSADPPFTALVAHPHPPSGGTMHHKVVYHAAKVFSSFGLPVLRFNFRGTGLSQGRHDNGYGEVDDVRSAIDWLNSTYARPVLFAGFSFGANVGLRACCGDARVRGLIALGLPLVLPQTAIAIGRHTQHQAASHQDPANPSPSADSSFQPEHGTPRTEYRYRFLPNCGAVPKLFVSGDHDAFCPQGMLESTLVHAAEPKKIVWVAGADHFFAGVRPENQSQSPDSMLGVMAETVRAWLAETFFL